MAAARLPLTPRTEPVGQGGLTATEDIWRDQANRHVRALNELLAERGAGLRFTLPAVIAIAGSAPLPEQAYAAALPVVEDLADVLQMATALLAAAKAGRQIPVADERVLLLKRAAVTDRLALADPTTVTVQRTAVREAHALMVFDTAHGTGRGEFGPDSITWDAAGGPRAYVRQEFAAWHVPLAPGEGLGGNS